MRLGPQLLGQRACARHAQYADVSRLAWPRHPCRRSCPASRCSPRSRARRPPPGTRGRRAWRSAPAAQSSRRAPRRSARPAPPRRGSARPVLWMCMNSSSGRRSVLPTLARSIAWPPAMPREPLATASIFSISSCALGSVGEHVLGQELKRERLQRVARPAARSPRRIRRGRWACRGAARRRPCTAGRRAPASRHGSFRPRRPRLRAAPASAPASSPAAKASSRPHALCRRRARRSASPGAGAPGRSPAPAGAAAARLPCAPGSLAHPGGEITRPVGRHRERLQRIGFEHLHLLLGLRELRLAVLRQLQAALVRGERLLEARAAPIPCRRRAFPARPARLRSSVADRIWRTLS